LLANFLPILIYPLLMLGGGYLCYEGAEKVWHVISPAHHDQADAVDKMMQDGAHLEEQKVKGAIKTDFILSAEIMTIVLSALPEGQPFWLEATALAVAGILITVAVYGAVALIVKMDDLGLAMVDHGRFALMRKLGLGIVQGMPYFLQLLIIVGTAAMIWVGGSILVHGLHEMGWHLPYDVIHDIAVGLAQGAGDMAGAVKWIVTAGLDGVLGLTVGALLIPLVGMAMGLFGGKKKEAH
jgi:predicted DNA repair protein MutK